MMLKKLLFLFFILVLIAVPFIVYFTLDQLPTGWLKVVHNLHLTIEATIVTWLLMLISIPIFRVLREMKRERLPRRGFGVHGP